jgi:hypothetical protein
MPPARPEPGQPSAKERTPSRAPRWTVFLVVGLAALLAIGAVALLLQDDTVEKIGAGGEPTSKGGEVAVPGTPAFRFAATHRLVRTAGVKLRRADRRIGARASAAAESLLTDLYVEAFLDPANWMKGTYDDAFGGFAREARRTATARTGLLTAGADAGSSYERIVPGPGKITTRVLLDREGRPALLVSSVRFSARATGQRPATLRSFGQYFLERRGGSWMIVSFHVTRSDVAPEGA